ncbi:MAG: hypothetical protein ACLRNQ_20720 [Flavonifractor plautii]
MKYDFETIIDRDPAIRGTGKYRIMKDSKGNKPPRASFPCRWPTWSSAPPPALLTQSKPRRTSACWATTA